MSTRMSRHPAGPKRIDRHACRALVLGLYACFILGSSGPEARGDDPWTFTGWPAIAERIAAATGDPAAAGSGDEAADPLARLVGDTVDAYLEMFASLPAEIRQGELSTRSALFVKMLLVDRCRALLAGDAGPERVRELLLDAPGMLEMLRTDASLAPAMRSLIARLTPPRRAANDPAMERTLPIDTTAGNAARLAVENARVIADFGGAGHGNGAIDAGEFVLLALPLRVNAAGQIRATLHSLDPFAGTAAEPVIDTASADGVHTGTAMSPATHALWVSPHCPDGHRLRLSLAIEGAVTTTIGLAVTVAHVGPVVLRDLVVDDDAHVDSSGNDNGAIEAGETIEYVSTPFNEGSVELTSVAASIHAASIHAASGHAGTALPGTPGSDAILLSADQKPITYRKLRAGRKALYKARFVFTRSSTPDHGYLPLVVDITATRDDRPYRFRTVLFEPTGDSASIEARGIARIGEQIDAGNMAEALALHDVLAPLVTTGADEASSLATARDGIERRMSILGSIAGFAALPEDARVAKLQEIAPETIDEMIAASTNPLVADVDAAALAAAAAVVAEARAPIIAAKKEAEEKARSGAIAVGSEGLLGIGGGSSGAFGGRRGGLRGGRGGKKAAEGVEFGLFWLANHQHPDGSWRADGFHAQCKDGHRCEGAGNRRHDVGVTGLAVLAFLGAGYTSDHGKYKDNLNRALTWLRSQQDDEGCFGSRADSRYMYGHAIATQAMCEAFGLSRKPVLLPSARKAVDFLRAARNPDRAWRYGIRPGDNDTSITAWSVMALLAADEAGLGAGFDELEPVRAFLVDMTGDNGRVGYTSRGGMTARSPDTMSSFPNEKSEAMTAAGMFTRILLGDDPAKTPALLAGADLCLATAPQWRNGYHDFVYWYFGALALNQVGGERFVSWNKSQKKAILEHQRREKNCGLGSWPAIDAWSDEGGTVYATAMLTMCLEVYYRYGRVVGARK